MLMGWCSPAIHSTYILEPDTLTHTDRQTGRQSVNQTDTYTHTNTNTHTDTNTHTLTQRQRHIFLWKARSHKCNVLFSATDATHRLSTPW
jgi:rRNA maturation endonuclease Nob1